MTNFIELTLLGDDFRKVNIPIHAICSFHDNPVVGAKGVFIQVIGFCHIVGESRQQIKDLIREAEQERPYQTK